WGAHRPVPRKAASVKRAAHRPDQRQPRRTGSRVAYPATIPAGQTMGSQRVLNHPMTRSQIPIHAAVAAREHAAARAYRNRFAVGLAKLGPGSSALGIAGWSWRNRWISGSRG